LGTLSAKTNFKDAEIAAHKQGLKLVVLREPRKIKLKHSRYKTICKRYYLEKQKKKPNVPAAPLFGLIDEAQGGGLAQHLRHRIAELYPVQAEAGAGPELPYPEGYNVQAAQQGDYGFPPRNPPGFNE
jgi:hypothetical protein